MKKLLSLATAALFLVGCEQAFTLEGEDANVQEVTEKAPSELVVGVSISPPSTLSEATSVKTLPFSLERSIVITGIPFAFADSTAGVIADESTGLINRISTPC